MTRIEISAQFLRTRLPTGSTEAGLESARGFGALAMVNISRDGGNEYCLAGLERELHCVPWEKEPRENLRLVKQALDEREEGQ